MRALLLAGVIAAGVALPGPMLAMAGDRAPHHDFKASLPASDRRAIVVSIPNHRGTAEARRQVDKALAGLERDYGLFLTIEYERWTGNRLRLRASLLGQPAVGHIDVGPSRVDVRILLPGSLTFLVDLAKPAILKAGTRMLAKK